MDSASRGAECVLAKELSDPSQFTKADPVRRIRGHSGSGPGQTKRGLATRMLSESVGLQGQILEVAGADSGTCSAWGPWGLVLQLPSSLSLKAREAVRYGVVVVESMRTYRPGGVDNTHTCMCDHFPNPFIFKYKVWD